MEARTMGWKDVSMWQRSAIAAVLLLTAGAALGCGKSAASTLPAQAPAGASADEQDATAGLMEHHRHHHHGGVTLLIAMSLDTLGILPEQKAAVEKLRIELHARMEPARAAEQNLVAALSEGVAAGALDDAKVDAAVAQMDGAATTICDASADALNQLHAVLTPPQRAALVDKVEAHWAVWQRVNTEESDHLADLAEELRLTADQVGKIRASLTDGTNGMLHFDAHEITAYIHGFGDAFRASAFDARTITSGGPATVHMVGWGAAHMAHFVEAVSPVLTPDQRARFSQILHEHASHNPSAGGG